MSRLFDLLRYQVGKRVHYLGFLLLPVGERRGLACMGRIGIAWAEANESDLLRVMRGEVDIIFKWQDNALVAQQDRAQAF